MKCPKHNTPYKRVELERGKTVDVCPKCEEETMQAIKEAFPVQKKSIWDKP